MHTSFPKMKNERIPAYEIISLDSRPDFLPLEKFNEDAPPPVYSTKLQISPTE